MNLFLQFAHRIPREYVFRVIAGSRTFSGKLSRVNALLLVSELRKKVAHTFHEISLPVELCFAKDIHLISIHYFDIFLEQHSSQ